MHVKAVLITIILCSGLISSLSTTAIATTYDNFDDSDFLDAARWTTGERTNLVVDGKLLSGFRKLGGAGSSNSQFSDRASVNAIQAVVNVNNIEAIGNPEIRARLAGFFCDSNNAADNSIGEIYAENTIIRFADGSLSFRYLVFQCGDASCNDGAELFNNTFGNPQLNTDYALALAFDPASRIFSFSIDGATSATFGPSDSAVLQNCGSSNSLFKGIGTRVSSADGSGDGGSIQATFDDVLVNGVLYDDFSGGTLDSARWRDSEGRVAVESDSGNNVLRIEQQRSGSDGSLSVTFTDSNTIQAIRTDVRVDSTEIVSVDGNGRVRARISGQFYNDGASSGPSDRTGDVFLQMFLRRDAGVDQDLYRVTCAAGRSNNPDFTDDTEIFFESLNATWQEGQTYRLTVGFDPSSGVFVCGFDDQTFTYTLQATDPQPAGPAVDGNKSLNTRVNGLDMPGERGAISAVFDNVQVSPPRPDGGFLFSSGFEAFPSF